MNILNNNYNNDYTPCISRRFGGCGVDRGLSRQAIPGFSPTRFNRSQNSGATQSRQNSEAEESILAAKDKAANLLEEAQQEERSRKAQFERLEERLLKKKKDFLDHLRFGY